MLVYNQFLLHTKTITNDRTVYDIVYCTVKISLLLGQCNNGWHDDMFRGDGTVYSVNGRRLLRQDFIPLVFSC